MARGAPIQPALIQYFMSRVGQPVKLADIMTELGEIDEQRVRNAISHLVRGSLPAELGHIRVVVRSAVWQLEGPSDPRILTGQAGLPPEFDAEAYDTEHSRWIESGSMLTFPVWRELQSQPVVGPPTPGPNGLTGQWSDEAAPSVWPSTPHEEWESKETPLCAHGDPQCDCLVPPQTLPMPERAFKAMLTASATDQAIADALETVHEWPTQQEWLEAREKKSAGDPRSLMVIVADIVVARANAKLQLQANGQDREAYDHLVVMTDKPMNAFEVDQAMFQRVGHTEDGASLLRAEDGTFWKATRI